MKGERRWSRPFRRGVAFRVLARPDVDAWNRRSYCVRMLKGENRDSSKAAGGSFVIRFNVRDLAGATNHLQQQGVDYAIYEFDWGSIAAFTDPDGNRCELKTPLGHPPAS